METTPSNEGRNNVELPSNTPSSVESLSRILRGTPSPIEFDIAILHSESDGDAFAWSREERALALHAPALPVLARDFRKHYKKTLSLHRSSNSDESIDRHLDDAINCLLLTCPDNSTAWANKRRILQRHESSFYWQSEMNFVDLLMTRHTKAPSAWHHRRFLFQNLAAGCLVENLIELAKKEIRLCQKVADRYPKNYYAWTHRIFVIRYVQSRIIENEDKQSSSSMHFLYALLEDEWRSIGAWLRLHVSDHSAAHYGGSVLRMLLGVCENQADSTVDERLPFVEQVVHESRNLVNDYPTHEVLWIFYRICIHAALDWVEIHHSDMKNSSALHDLLAKFYHNDILHWVVTHRAQSLKDKQSEAWREAQQSKLYSLSYVVWILERTKHTKGLHTFFNSQDSKQLQRQALLLLTHCDNNTHNVFQ